MKRLAAIALVLASCVPSSDPNVNTVLTTCLTDAGLTYAEIPIFVTGWYAITYPTLDGHWENGVWLPHPSQSTTWQYAYGSDVHVSTTLISRHAGGLQVWWSGVKQPGDDDPPYPVKGGIAPAATAHCAQSAATPRGVQ